MSDVAARRARVEAGLTPALRIAGRAPERCSLAERMERYCVPGVSVAVIADGAIEWQAGYGVTTPGGAAVTAQTLFQAASISKAVSAVAALALVERGLFSLDDDVNEHLSSWQLPPSAFTQEVKVTPRHLLSHTAGTTVPGFPGYEVADTLPSLPDVLSGCGGANTERVESFAVPGSVSQYSGGGTTIMQQMICDLTGAGFGEVVHELVLAPFEMLDSEFDQPLRPARAGRAASAHDAQGTRIPGGMHVYAELAAAGLWTTCVDLARFVLGVQRILSGVADGPISPAMARLMVTEVGPGPFGLGPELASSGATKRFHHNGTNIGFCSNMEGFVERAAGAVVMTNGVGGNTLLGEIRRAIADEYAWPDFFPPPIELAEVPEHILATYAGRYVGVFDRPLRLDLIDGVLSSPSPYGRRKLLPLSETRFVDEETGAILEMELDAGRVVRIPVLVDGAEIMAFTPAESQ